MGMTEPDMGWGVQLLLPASLFGLALAFILIFNLNRGKLVSLVQTTFKLGKDCYRHRRFRAFYECSFRPFYRSRTVS